jgi:hypothetical protein
VILWAQGKDIVLMLATMDQIYPRAAGKNSAMLNGSAPTSAVVSLGLRHCPDTVPTLSRHCPDTVPTLYQRSHPYRHRRRTTQPKSHKPFHRSLARLHATTLCQRRDYLRTVRMIHPDKTSSAGLPPGMYV